MAAKTIKKCLICGKPADPSSKYYPFCSQRCQTIDLGNWASEKYIVTRPLTEADEKLMPSEEEKNDD